MAPVAARRDPIGTGVINQHRLVYAVTFTIGTENVVLKGIGEENTLAEFAEAFRALKADGWDVD